MAIEVQTTQNVTVDYEPAGVGYRILGYLIDVVIAAIWIIAWVGLYNYVGSNIFGSMDEFTFWLLASIFVFAPVIFYDLLFEIFNNGQSPGKMILKIRVVNVDGTAPSVGSYLLRWLFRTVDFSFTNGLLGVIMVAATKKGQRLGDYLAGTTVVDLKGSAKNKRLTIRDLDFHDDYKVSYPDLLDKLSDRDIQIILSILNDTRMHNNDFFNKRLADRIKSMTGYGYYGADKVFLKKIVDDYNYLALQQ